MSGSFQTVIEEGTELPDQLGGRGDQEGSKKRKEGKKEEEEEFRMYHKGKEVQKIEGKECRKTNCRRQDKR